MARRPRGQALAEFALVFGSTLPDMAVQASFTTRTMEAVAAAAGGIAYSILTGIGRRVRRNVLEEDR